MHFGFSTTFGIVRLAGASSDVQIAHAENIATGAASVTLTVNTVELKSFITALSELIVKIKNKGSNNYVCIDFSQGVVQVEVQK